jgi:AraC family ethanolamine operon transcriptional activator
MDYILSGTFQDFDLFATQVKAWDLDFVQLERGAPSYEILMAGVGEVQVGYAQFNRKIYQRGAAPVGKRTVAIPLYPDMELQWYGQHVTGCDLMVFPDDGELVSLSLPQFEVVVYSISTEHLERMCAELELPSFEKVISGRSVFRLPRAMMQGLRDEAVRLLKPLKFGKENWSASAMYREQLEYDFARSLVSALAYSRGSLLHKRPTRHKRSACVQQVIELLVLNESVPSISALCDLVNVSERTLQYAFRDEFDVTPKQFIKAWKLNAVRRELAGIGASRKVAHVAVEHGFWHMGQFAADYRKMFGELPSETVQRQSA